MAERTVPETFELTEADVDELKFVGLLGLADPVHPTTAEAVTQLSGAVSCSATSGGSLGRSWTSGSSRSALRSRRLVVLLGQMRSPMTS
ncbi:hypothetical protein ACWDKQ_15800 [Saccharopolyspora sp. NPDC000995]